jgi:hypothetical protein
MVLRPKPRNHPSLVLRIKLANRHTRLARCDYSTSTRVWPSCPQPAVHEALATPCVTWSNLVLDSIDSVIITHVLLLFLCSMPVAHGPPLASWSFSSSLLVCHRFRSIARRLHIYKPRDILHNTRNTLRHLQFAGRSHVGLAWCTPLAHDCAPGMLATRPARQLYATAKGHS